MPIFLDGVSKLPFGESILIVRSQSPLGLISDEFIINPWQT
jgi:hypothetical protein